MQLFFRKPHAIFRPHRVPLRRGRRRSWGKAEYPALLHATECGQPLYHRNGYEFHPGLCFKWEELLPPLNHSTFFLFQIQCSELCHWHRVVDIVGCTGPWMPDIDVDQCDTANETQQLIKHYKLQADQDSVICGCFQPCSTTIYTAFVMNRKKFNITIPAGQIWLYYTSKMVTVGQRSIRSSNLSSFLCIADRRGVSRVRSDPVCGRFGRFAWVSAWVVRARADRTARKDRWIVVHS